MNQIKREIDEFIGDEPRFNHALCKRVISEIQEGTCKKRALSTIANFRYAFMLLLILSFASVLTVSLINDESGIGTGIITDPDTTPEIEFVSPEKHHILFEWGSDAMDRGDHDYYKMNRKLVIEPQYITPERGDVILYKMPSSAIERNPNIPEDYLGRIVGLPGETIKIVDGVVYINNQQLDTFYGEATIFGMGEDQYFQNADLSRLESIESTRTYFNTNMEPIQVEEGTVFVLVDAWWRGTDSKDFGLLPVERIQGKVLGYQK